MIITPPLLSVSDGSAIPTDSLFDRVAGYRRNQIQQFSNSLQQIGRLLIHPRTDTEEWEREWDTIQGLWDQLGSPWDLSSVEQNSFLVRVTTVRLHGNLPILQVGSFTAYHLSALLPEVFGFAARMWQSLRPRALPTVVDDWIIAAHYFWGNVVPQLPTPQQCATWLDHEETALRCFVHDEQRSAGQPNSPALATSKRPKSRRHPPLQITSWKDLGIGIRGGECWGFTPVPELGGQIDISKGHQISFRRSSHWPKIFRLLADSSDGQQVKTSELAQVLGIGKRSGNTATDDDDDDVHEKERQTKHRQESIMAKLGSTIKGLRRSMKGRFKGPTQCPLHKTDDVFVMQADFTTRRLIGNSPHSYTFGAAG